MKKYFITGLVILLPLALTIAILAFFFNLLTEPFTGLLQWVFNYYDLFQSNFLKNEKVQHYISQVIIFLFLFLFTVLLGMFARWFFIHYLIRFGESLFQRIPFVSSIYKTCKDVIKTVFASKTNSFKQVVMVRFPNPETYTLGLVTREDLPDPNGSAEPLVAVFVPTTPNPTSGFLIMYRPADVVYLDMKVEEAFKYIISCGVIMSPVKMLTKDEANGKYETQIELPLGDDL